jgi:hypothetical protein
MSKKLTGYRLHFKRILFSGGEIIRTIKFPILTHNDDIFIKTFKRRLINDDLKIRGDLNLNDYLEYTALGKPVYTLFDFWIDSLKAGIIWLDKPASLIDFLNDYYQNEKSPFNLVWERANEEIRDYFDKVKFKEILISDPLRSTSKKSSFNKRLIKCLKEEYFEKKDNNFLVKSLKAKAIIEKIVNSFFDNRGNLILDGKEQNKFWLDNFCIDKSIIEKAKPKGELADITFIIIPELIEDLEKEYEVEYLVKKRKNWLEKRFDDIKEVEEKLEKILGLSNNFNGFSNFLGKALRLLQNEKIEVVFEAINTIYSQLGDQKNKEIILKSLNFLSEKSKLIDKEPSLNMIKNWADYRSFFGGKLLSWYSNTLRRKKELNTQVNKFKNSLSRAKKYLFNKNLISQEFDKKQLEIIKFKIERIEEFLNNYDIVSEKNYFLFDEILSSLKSQLNLYYQKYLIKDNEEKNIEEDNRFSGIYERIYKPVAFFGKTSRERNKKIIEKTLPIIEDGINNIFILINYLKTSFSPKITFEKAKSKNENEESILRKLLNYYWNKKKSQMINSFDFLQKIEEIIRKNVDEKEWEEIQIKKNWSKYVFYKSPYQKGSVSQIKINKKNYLEVFEEIVLELTSYLLSFKIEQLLEDKKLLLDWIETAKNILSKLIRFNERKSFIFEDLGINLNNFQKARDYIEMFKIKKVSRDELGFIIQNLIFAEIKGAATLFSKERYLAKYNVQVISPESKFKLFYHPKDNLIEEDRKKLMKPHEYFIALDEIREKKLKDKSNFLKLLKNEIEPVFINEKDLSKLYKISSSVYQIQFLDKFIYLPERWKDIKITLSEWNFIVEEEYKLKWNFKTKKPEFKLIENSKRNKLYVAIPFNISFRGDKDNVAIKKVINNRLEYPILGIDVGEYGLAYVLVKFSKDKIEILDKGFIEDKNISKIKDRFKEIQQRAKSGIFNEIDTIISRVRENAVGSLRNKVHFVLTNDAGASIVYEYSISNFETGSGRTTRIYNSVKRADTEFESEADKQIHSHIWGKGSKYIGRNLNAYGSSYTCTKCYSSLYQFKKEDLTSVVVKEKNGNIIIFSTPLGTIKGYSKDKKYQIGYKLKATDEQFNEFIKIIKDFARPPVGKDKSEALEKYFLDNKEKKDQVENFRKKRGASAIFICPFCGFVADADIQAAFIMAVRGYLKFKADNKENKEEKQVILEKTIEMLKKYKFEPQNIFNPF